MVGLSLYCVASMIGMYWIMKKSKIQTMSILDFDLKVEIFFSILAAPLFMPIILLMMIMYHFIGTDDDHNNLDMSMYFQTALILFAFVSLTLVSIAFPINDTHDRQPAQTTVCECKK